MNSELSFKKHHDWPQLDKSNRISYVVQKMKGCWNSLGQLLFLSGSIRQVRDCKALEGQCELNGQWLKWSSCPDVRLCVGPDLGLEVSLICQYMWGRLMTYLAHPRLALAHGFSPLHHLPQPSLPYQRKQMRECCFMNIAVSEQVHLYQQWHCDMLTITTDKKIIYCILQSSKHCGYSKILTMCMKQTNELE